MLTPSERSWLRLHLTEGLGRLGLFQLYARFGSAERALRNNGRDWPDRLGRRRSDTLALPAADDPRYLAAINAVEHCGGRIISYWDPDYPQSLQTIHDPPALLYVRGRLPRDEGLAVVGSRNASPAGLELTRQICLDLAAAGIVIISGLARGIDSTAHQAAIDSGGLTIAVLGCGIDRVYPSEHRQLFHDITAAGAVISEYPPGTRPLPGHFPGRNRIISGLAKGVLIVEAARKSGSLITADFALEQGREVFAIPGAVTAPNSCGVNSLLKDGAHLVTEARDITEVLFAHRVLPPPGAGKPEAIELSERERAIVEHLDHEPQHVDELARKSGLTPMELSATLLQLEVRGGVIQLPGMRYMLSRQTLQTAT